MAEDERAAAVEMVAANPEAGDLIVGSGGCRKIIFMNSHGGNVPVIDIVARELRVRADMLVVKCHWSRLGRPAGVYGPRELKYGIHAGDSETSLMLHFRPDLVDMARAEDFASVVEREEQRFTHLRATGPACARMAFFDSPHMPPAVMRGLASAGRVMLR